jgi:hypothetical protein
VKIIALTVVALAIASAATQAASAKEFGRTETPGDMNMFQIEPSILNERFYTSGKAERQQYCGKVLPAGAAIPDNDAPLSEQKPVSKESKEIKETPSSSAPAASSVTNKDSAAKDAASKPLGGKTLSP